MYHYPRNSMEPLGKNLIKFKVLNELGYHPGSFAIPYYDWAILESRQRRSYLQALIDNAIA